MGAHERQDELLADRGTTVSEPLPPRARVFVNDARTVLVDLWPDGTVTVATRQSADQIWSPPIYLKEEA